MRIFYIFLLLLFSHQSISSIELDGVLDEAEWSLAQKFEKMVLIEPYVLSQAQYTTEIFVTTDVTGIYFGIKNYQPIASRNSDVSARDQRISSDKVQLILDFDNNAITAYSFEVGIGGSIRDGIYSDENQFSNEWDGNWQAQTADSQDYWTAEILIPWDVVSMKKADTEDRHIKWYLSRTIADQNQRYANVAANENRQRFLSEFVDLSIKDYAAPSLQLFVYGTTRKDFHAQDQSFDAGLDLFWKSGQGKQLTATFNPDFGQIESDRLVVNFSATETFFNERRPFFTENQSLFDVRGANGLRILHTRRIGGRPDTGTGVATDIDTAVKFTDNRDKFTYGLFAASEASGDGFDGRDYFASRFLRKTEKQTLGFTGTFVDRTDIDRTAMAYAFDHEYLWGSKFKLKSQFVRADIDESDNQVDGWGGFSRLLHQINENQQQTFQLSHYDRDFEINDFGFLPRNSLNSAFYQHNLKQTQYQESAKLQRRVYNLDVIYESNDQGNTLGTQIRFTDSWQFKDSSSFGWDVFLFSKGANDLISRDHGLVNTNFGHRVGITYRSSNANKFRHHGFLRRTDRFGLGTEYATHIHPSYFFQDNYSASLSIFYRDSDDWLNWIDNDIFGRYDRKLLNTSLDFNANFSQRQELRFRLQWIAIDAQANNQYQLNTDGNLQLTGNEINDFSLSNTALQIRYRYEVAPLSNIFIVYTRGASVFNEFSENLNSLFSPGFSHVNSDNFIIKFRYKFF
jgi:hypothetical protein